MENKSINNIRTVKQLTPYSGMSLEIIRVVSDDQVDMTDMVAVINKSPAITARILRCANSAYYGQRGQISTVREAIIRVLGLSITRGLTLAMALSSDFETDKVRNFDERRYWFNAVTTANIAQSLSHYVVSDDRPAPATAYTAGLIYNIGIQALIHCFPEIMNRIFAQASVSLKEQTYAEIGLDHHEASALLAQNWDLPDILCRALGAKHEQESITCIVSIAAELSDQIFTSASDNLEDIEIDSRIIEQKHVAKVMKSILNERDNLMDMANLIARTKA
ncbi:MAG: HDOD domain-containing protein [Desulfuromonadaceae bacterium]